ncbi:MAG TPA: tripartite tricarboxylate transporter substrate-binding protein [Xanthobacteraceae bacterium]
MSGAGALGLSLAALPSRPARAADYYRGKTLTMIVGFAPGGGVDSQARTIARHLVRFIPGQPGMVVQNMEGAAGAVAANFINQRAAPDGLTISTPGRSWFIEGVVKGAGIGFDPTKFTYIGSAGGSNSVAYVRPATGIRSLADLKSSKQTVTFGSLAATTPTAMVPHMLAALGAPIKVVLGYVSTARVLVALEQGEIDAVFTVADSFARRQDLIARGIVVPILQSKPGLADLPLLRDILPARDLPLLTLVMGTDSFGLPLVGPPGMAAEATEILRQAFLDMVADPDYRADALKADLPVGAPLEGSELAAMINEIASSATPEIIAAYRKLSAAK